MICALNFYVEFPAPIEFKQSMIPLNVKYFIKTSLCDHLSSSLACHPPPLLMATTSSSMEGTTNTQRSRAMATVLQAISNHNHMAMGIVATATTMAIVTDSPMSLSMCQELSRSTSSIITRMTSSMATMIHLPKETIRQQIMRVCEIS